MNLLKVKDLSVYFRDKKVLNRLSFELSCGEILGIVGESGSGKSVCALSVLGLLPYPLASHDKTSSIKLNSKELLGAKSLKNVRGKEIGFVFQEPMSALNPLHKVKKQLVEAILVHQNISVKEAEDRALELLKQVELKDAEKRLDSYPFELSGGEKQRILIAIAIANSPKLLIADEPTTALDVTVQAQILELLKKIVKDNNMAMIFISHDLGVINKICDNILVLKDGNLIEFGTKTEIFNNPQAGYTKELMGSYLAAKKTGPLGDVLLEVDGLSVCYGDKKAVNSVSFLLKKGQTLGIAGESGSGKTSVAMALLKLVSFCGDIKYLGQKIQVVFQDPYNSLNPRMKVSDIIGEGLEIYAKGMPKSERIQMVESVLEKVGLQKSDALRYPHQFSGGQRQRIAIARAIIIKPEVLILDEPTSALDVTIQSKIIDLLIELQKEFGLSYIFISHDLRVLRAMCDEIIIMKDGIIVESNNTTELFEKPQQLYTKDLLASAI